MVNPVAVVWLVAALPAIASHGHSRHAVSADAFDFSVKKEAPPKKGLLKQILDRVDGGDFHGFGNADGTSAKAENYLRTSTVRAKIHF